MSEIKAPGISETLYLSSNTNEEERVHLRVRAAFLAKLHMLREAGVQSFSQHENGEIATVVFFPPSDAK